MPSDVMFVEVRHPAQVKTVAALADVIWREHYTPIIGEAQVEYMLTHFHSEQHMERELNEGALYYLIQNAGEPVGYFCVKPEKETLFLSKLYVLASERGGGIGRLSMQLIKEIAMERGLATIRLTVNRHNSASIAAYQKWGFEIAGEVCADIGGGYVMDDYAMELHLNSQA